MPKCQAAHAQVPGRAPLQVYACTHPTVLAPAHTLARTAIAHALLPYVSRVHCCHAVCCRMRMPLPRMPRVRAVAARSTSQTHNRVHRVRCRVAVHAYHLQCKCATTTHPVAVHILLRGTSYHDAPCARCPAHLCTCPTMVSCTITSFAPVRWYQYLGWPSKPQTMSFFLAKLRSCLCKSRIGTTKALARANPKSS